MGLLCGFRAVRNPHNTLYAVTVALECERVNRVLDADVCGFYR